jgi:Tfp pilus assembly protein PilO
MAETDNAQMQMDQLYVARSNHQQEREELEHRADYLLRQLESAKLMAENANEAKPAAGEALTTDEIQQLKETLSTLQK